MSKTGFHLAGDLAWIHGRRGDERGWSTGPRRLRVGRKKPEVLVPAEAGEPEHAGALGIAYFGPQE
jgi:hypothetical protein